MPQCIHQYYYRVLRAEEWPRLTEGLFAKDNYSWFYKVAGFVAKGMYVVDRPYGTTCGLLCHFVDERW